MTHLQKKREGDGDAGDTVAPTGPSVRGRITDIRAIVAAISEHVSSIDGSTGGDTFADGAKVVGAPILTESIPVGRPDLITGMMPSGGGGGSGGERTIAVNFRI